MKPVVDLFTDGSCPANPGPGGWAFILRIRGTDKHMKASGGDRATTNNRMEMMAVIEGLKRLPPGSKVHLVSDSQYVIHGMTKWRFGWKKKNWQKKNEETGKLEPIKNPDLWQQLDALMEQHEVECEWVRGHKGHCENEQCDEMAGLATKAIMEQIKAES